MSNVKFNEKNVYKSEKTGSYYITVQSSDFKINDKIVFKCQFALDKKTINFKDKKTGEDKSFEVGTMVVRPILGIDEKYVDEKYKSVSLKFSGKILEHLINCEPTQEYKLGVDTFEKDGKEIKYLVLSKIKEEASTKVEFSDDNELPF